MISVEEALARLSAPLTALPAEQVSISDAVGRVLAEDVAALDRLGIGGIIGTFRLGPMPHAVAAESLSLFMREVAPSFRGADGR